MEIVKGFIINIKKSKKKIIKGLIKINQKSLKNTN